METKDLFRYMIEVFGALMLKVEYCGMWLFSDYPEDGGSAFLWNIGN